MLASSIAEEFQTEQSTTLFYSFSGMDTDRQSIDGLLRTFLWQLLQDDSDDRRLEIVLNLMRGGPPGIGELWDTFKEVMAVVPGRVNCIIDGTNECRDLTPVLFDRIYDLLDTCVSTHAILLGRPRGLRSVQASTTIKINSEIIKDDIERFIDTKIRESAIRTLPGNHEDMVSRALKLNSDGMFLWAKSMIDELSRSPTPFNVRKRLCNLPRGIEEAYRHLLLQLLERLSPLEIGLAQRVMAFTTVACRDLSLKEVQYACALDSMSSSANSILDDHLHPEKTILEVCGDFISIRDGLVHFVHFSFKQFLTRPEGEWSGSDQRIASFRVDIEKSHLRLGSTCLDFLTTGRYASPSGGVADASYGEVMACYPFLAYASIYVISHLRQFGKPCSATLARLWSFVRSEKCITWMEYLSAMHMESYSFETLFEDLERVSLWPGGEQLGRLPVLLRKELARRVHGFGEHDPFTDHWRLIVEVFQPLESKLPVPQSESTTSTAIYGPPPIPGTTLSGLPRIIDGPSNNLVLPLNQQVNLPVVPRMQSYFSQVNVLMDSLQMLSCIILRKKPAIAICGLIAIADFYQRVNKLEGAPKVYSADLKRTEGQRVSTKPWILGKVGGILQRQREHKDAGTTCKKALKEREMIRGEGHAKTAFGYRLAGDFYSQDRFTSAEVLHQHAPNMRRMVPVAGRPNILVSASKLGPVLHCRGKIGEDEVLHQNPSARGRKALGADRSKSPVSAGTFGPVLRCHGKPASTGRGKALGTDRPATLGSASNIAGTVYSQDRLAWAEALDRRTLARIEQARGASHPCTLVSASNLASTLYKQGKFAEAEALYQRVLTGREKALGADHRDTLVSASKLASTLHKQSKFADAESLLRRVLTGREKALGADHPLTLVSASNLACTLHSQDKFAEAEVLNRRTLTGREKILGAGDPDTLVSTSNLASTLDSQGELVEAEALHRHALVEREKALGAEHLDTLVSTSKLAGTLHNQGKFAEAEVLHRCALAGTEKALGANHPDTLLATSNLASTLHNQGKFAEAEALHRRVLTGREKALGADHPDTVLSASNLAGTLYGQDKFDEAEVLHRRALIGREKALGADHLDTLLPASNLASTLHNQGKYAEAEVLHRRALTGREIALGADHPDTLVSASNLAGTLCSRDKFAEAEALLRRALAGTEMVFGADHPNTLISASNLAGALYRQGKSAEAKALHPRTPVGREAQGTGHCNTLDSTNSLAGSLLMRGSQRPVGDKIVVASTVGVGWISIEGTGELVSGVPHAIWCI